MKTGVESIRKYSLEKNAIEKTIDLLQMPCSISQIISNVYPNEKNVKNRKARIRGYLKTLKIITSKKRRVTWSRNGLEKYRKLLRDFVENKSRVDDLIPNKNILRKLNNYQYKNLDKNAKAFYSELTDMLKDEFFLYNPVKVNRDIDKLITKISKASVLQLPALNPYFLEKWHEMSKYWKPDFMKTGKSKFVKWSNSYEYVIDKEKIFSQYVKINKLPSSYVSIINTNYFKAYLTNRFSNYIEYEHFTARNVKKAIEKTLIYMYLHDNNEYSLDDTSGLLEKNNKATQEFNSLSTDK